MRQGRSGLAKSVAPTNFKTPRICRPNFDMFPSPAFLLSSVYGISLAQPVTAPAENFKRIADTIFEHGCAEGFEAIRDDQCIVKCVDKSNPSDVVVAPFIGPGNDDCCRYNVYLNGGCPCKARGKCEPDCEKAKPFVAYNRCLERNSNGTASAYRLSRASEIISDNGCAEGFAPVRQGGCVVKCVRRSDPSDVVEALFIARGEDDCCKFQLYVNGNCPCKARSQCKQGCTGKTFTDFEECREKYLTEQQSK